MNAHMHVSAPECACATEDIQDLDCSNVIPVAFTCCLAMPFEVTL